MPHLRALRRVSSVSRTAVCALGVFALRCVHVCVRERVCESVQPSYLP